MHGEEGRGSGELGLDLRFLFYGARRPQGHAKLESDWSISIAMAACVCDNDLQLSKSLNLKLLSDIAYLIIWQVYSNVAFLR